MNRDDEHDEHDDLEGNEEAADEAPAKPQARTNILLFALTTVTVFYAGAAYATRLPEPFTFMGLVKALPQGYAYALPLLAILLTHEFGHYFAAREHRVAASLPYFIPMPVLSPFGTMGAVISMPHRIRSRNALLDIGAAGPLAGLVVALPIWCYGIATSEVAPLGPQYVQEGQSILYWVLKRIFAGPIPDGSDLNMNPIAFAGWTGALVTMLNLVPVGQLDGGHIAYALFGKDHNKTAKWLHYALLLPVVYNVARFVVPVLARGAFGELGSAITNSTFWLTWFAIIAGMRYRAGVNHPPVDPSELSSPRRVVAWISLAIFILLFQPTPWAKYG